MCKRRRMFAVLALARKARVRRRWSEMARSEMPRAMTGSSRSWPMTPDISRDAGRERYRAKTCERRLGARRRRARFARQQRELRTSRRRPPRRRASGGRRRSGRGTGASRARAPSGASPCRRAPRAPLLERELRRARCPRCPPAGRTQRGATAPRRCTAVHRDGAIVDIVSYTRSANSVGSRATQSRDRRAPPSSTCAAGLSRGSAHRRATAPERERGHFQRGCSLLDTRAAPSRMRRKKADLHRACRAWCSCRSATSAV